MLWGIRWSTLRSIWSSLNWRKNLKQQKRRWVSHLWFYNCSEHFKVNNGQSRECESGLFFINLFSFQMQETQEELSAWKFTPDSVTGKRLMSKCRQVMSTLVCWNHLWLSYDTTCFIFIYIFIWHEENVTVVYLNVTVWKFAFAFSCCKRMRTSAKWSRAGGWQNWKGNSRCRKTFAKRWRKTRQKWTISFRYFNDVKRDVGIEISGLFEKRVSNELNFFSCNSSFLIFVIRLLDYYL